jgi:hypothetical protein
MFLHLWSFVVFFFLDKFMSGQIHYYVHVFAVWKSFGLQGPTFQGYVRCPPLLIIAAIITANTYAGASLQRKETHGRHCVFNIWLCYVARAARARPMGLGV